MRYFKRILHPYTPLDELGFDLPSQKRIAQAARIARGLQRSLSRSGGGLKTFSARVLERDGYQCQHCRDIHMEPFIGLEAHHICPRHLGRGHSRLSDIRNGVTLCHKCHLLLHQHRLGMMAADKWNRERSYLDDLRANPLPRENLGEGG